MFDASLTGIGLRVFNLDDRVEDKLAFVMGFNTGFDFQGNFKFRNTMEFMAVVMGMVLLASAGIGHAGIG